MAAMVIMGHVNGPFGILGWIKVTPYTAYIDGLLDYPIWWLGKENGHWHEMNMIDAQIVNDKTLKAKLEGCNDRTHALQFKGLNIAIPRDQLPALPQNGESGYYWSDLIGLETLNLENERIGTIIGFFETGANDVIRIQPFNQDDREILIPFVDQYVLSVDLESAQMIVDWHLEY